MRKFFVVIALMVLSGCGNRNGKFEGVLWSDIDLDQYDSIPKFEELEWDTFTPSEETTYLEVREQSNFITYDEYKVIGSIGEKCSQAVDYEACVSNFDQMVPESVLGIYFNLVPPNYTYFAVNQGDVSFLLVTREEALGFIEPIDSEAEAAFLVGANGYNWSYRDKEEGGIRPVDGGCLAIAIKNVKYCLPTQTNRYLLRVGTDGSVTVLREQVLERSDESCA
jgi:hypothetical protein